MKGKKKKQRKVSLKLSQEGEEYEVDKEVAERMIDLWQNLSSLSTRLQEYRVPVGDPIKLYEMPIIDWQGE